MEIFTIHPTVMLFILLLIGLTTLFAILTTVLMMFKIISWPIKIFLRAVGKALR